MDELMHKIRQAYRMDETACLEYLLPIATLPSASLAKIEKEAGHLIQAVRANRLGKSGLDAFLVTYDLSSEEGVALMCLAESLLRVPDAHTIDRLIKDKMLSKNWEQHLGKSASWFVNAGTWGLLLTGKILKPSALDPNTLKSTLHRFLARVGEPVIRTALLQGMKILGQQFVMAETIQDALKRSAKYEARGYCYSYDMLGEAAKTQNDALNYFNAYQAAISAVGQASQGKGPIEGPGISVKLSALHPRYEWVKREQVFAELLPRLKLLCIEAKKYNIGLTIDAEEATRLEISLELLEALCQDPALSQWEGLGLALQAYQKRAIYVIDWLDALSKRTQRVLMVRLVKGAYWDTEIKFSQEKGLSGYPVFTRKSSTDVCYLACAKKLLAANTLYPQFASHNAYTVAAILEMVNLLGKEKPFEFQCLHGMGDALFDELTAKGRKIPCRIYAPVGGHEYLLGYLVRRLLENGANTSFVNRIMDEKLPIEVLMRDPVVKTAELLSKPHPEIPLPKDLFAPIRANSEGVDLSNVLETDPLLKEISAHFPDLFENDLPDATKETVEETLHKAAHAFLSWKNVDVETRARYLENMAHILQAHQTKLLALLLREGGKTVQDAVSELREAIDFCGYYAWRLREDFAVNVLPGPTGEYNQLTLHGRGVVTCISPWNFPLAIFLGQVLAALAAGNTVIAKPASHTPRIAIFAVSLLHQAGFPKDVVQVLVGRGSTLGVSLIEDPCIKGVMLTGGTETARMINQNLALRAGSIVPFIAETGGQNAMIVDSTALPEQVVDDVIVSAFNSAGQRCSALRVLFLQADIADRVIEMLKGAMAMLEIGDPYLLSTDVGPIIDDSAKQVLLKHVERMSKEATLIYECTLKEDLPALPKGVFFAPRAYEIKDISVLTEEVFGPILHIVRFAAKDLDKVLDSINNTGFGLTLGIHSRIFETAEYIHRRLRVGNTYVNRNMIGAVVGVQPFGGEGLSGTGPKAGGPHILPRLATERTLSVNIAATGGNVALLSLEE